MLTEDKRKQLDGIVAKMSQNKESDKNIQFVVNDFKKKYETTEKKSRLSSAKDAFVGSFKSAGEKLGRAQESFSQQGGNVFTNPKASMALLGAGGDIVSSAFAGITGLAQPEIEKGVTKVIEKTPQGAKDFLGKQVGKLSNETKQFAGDTLSASALFALSGVGKEATKTGLKGAINKTGKAIEKSGVKSTVKTKASFLDDLVKPKQTIKAAEDSVSRSKEVGKGIFKRTVTELSPDEKAAKNALMKVKSITAKDTAQGVYNKTDDAIAKEASSLSKQLAKKDVIFPKQELKSTLKKVATKLDDNINIGSDSKGAVEKMLRKVTQMIDDAPSKGSSLLKTRKAFDKWVKSQKGDLWSGNDTAIKVANREIRSSLNDFLAGKAIGTPVAKSLKTQSDLFKAIKSLIPKAGAEAKTVPGRAVQKLENALGKNKTIKEIMGALAIGGTVATGTAPLVAGGLATFLTGKGLVNIVKNPQNRILLGKLLQELSKSEVKTLATTEINAIKQNIQEALNN